MTRALSLPSSNFYEIRVKRSLGVPSARANPMGIDASPILWLLIPDHPPTATMPPTPPTPDRHVCPGELGFVALPCRTGGGGHDEERRDTQRPQGREPRQHTHHRVSAGRGSGSGGP